MTLAWSHLAWQRADSEVGYWYPYSHQVSRHANWEFAVSRKIGLQQTGAQGLYDPL